MKSKYDYIEYEHINYGKPTYKRYLHCEIAILKKKIEKCPCEEIKKHLKLELKVIKSRVGKSVDFRDYNVTIVEDYSGVVIN